MRERIKLEKLFIIISLFIGTLLVIIVPPYNSPDEDTHFMYSYEISKGNFLPSINDKKSGHYIPISLLDSINKNKEIIGNVNAKYSYSDIYYDNILHNDYTEKGFVEINVQNQPIIAYLAPAFGAKLAMNLSAYYGGEVSSVVLLQFARFFSLLIYSIICYFAIKITPKFKNSFFAILLLPMSLFLRSTVSYDGFILAITALTLSNILRLIEIKNVKFRKRDFIFFVVTGFLLLNVKTIYSIVLAGLLAVPDDKFDGKKRKWKNFIAMIFIVLTVSVARKFLYSRFPSASNPLFEKQIQFIINHPINYLKIVVYNFMSELRIMSIWMIGTYGCLDTVIPLIIHFLIKLYLFFVIMIDAFHEKISISVKMKIMYFVLILFAVFSIYSYMYIYWTPLVTNEVGGSNIRGVQGRYYIPLLLLLPIIFNNNILYIIKNEKIKKIGEKVYNIYNDNFHYFTIFSLVVMIFIIIFRFYI